MKIIRATLALGILALVSVPGPLGNAAPGLSLVTNYPAVFATSGKNVTFTVSVITPGRSRVDLFTEQVPPGWNVVLRGGGSIVSSVMGGPDNPPDQRAPEVTAEVQVPADASGEHTILLKGNAGGIIDTLPLTIKISDSAGGAVTLTADYPTLRGKADTPFTFKLTLANNTPEKTTFALNAEGPPGWQLIARPTAETRASTVTVDGGGTGTIDVEATAPKDVPSGEYVVKVTAQGAGKEATSELKIEVTGTTNLELNTANDRLNIKARSGQSTEVPLAIANNGSAPIKELTFTNSAPSGWKVEFSPENVTNVAPQKIARVTAKVTPSGDAVAGDYNVTLTASGDGATSVKDLRVAVQTSRVWAVIGLALIIGTFLGLRWVFRTYGRR